MIKISPGMLVDDFVAFEGQRKITEILWQIIWSRHQFEWKGWEPFLKKLEKQRRNAKFNFISNSSRISSKIERGIGGGAGRNIFVFALVDWS
jgi:hypothetical protein